MYEHGIAAFALAESLAAAKAFGKPPDRQILAAARKAIADIQEHQHADGGWRYTEVKSEASDTSVSGWQVLALKSAHEAGFPFSDTCMRKVKGFFQQCESGGYGQTSYTVQGRSTEATTGVGMLVHQFLLNDPDAACQASRTLPGRPGRGIMGPQRLRAGQLLLLVQLHLGHAHGWRRTLESLERRRAGPGD